MLVLGIETSCDETSAAVVKDGRHVLSNKVSSSLAFHKKYGGVVPEIAFRKQLETVAAVSDCALKQARVKLREIGLVSVTAEPGLLGSLLVGVSFAKAISLSSGIPILGVNHIHSHIYANFLNRPAAKLPFIALVVSGGHTSLFYLKGFERIDTLGSTQDDACGEAFDKVAKILGLGYPGGPAIERIARKGDPKKIKFSCSGTKQPLDFSFSGIKTGVLYYVKKLKLCSAKDKADIAASFQEAACETLVRKSFLACEIKHINRLVVGGGVVANNRLREKFNLAAAKSGISVSFPEREFCLDNAAMVAGFGFQQFKKGARSTLYLTA